MYLRNDVTEPYYYHWLSLNSLEQGSMQNFELLSSLPDHPFKVLHT